MIYVIRESQSGGQDESQEQDTHQTMLEQAGIELGLNQAEKVSLELIN